MLDLRNVMLREADEKAKQATYLLVRACELPEGSPDQHAYLSRAARLECEAHGTRLHFKAARTLTEEQA